MAAVFGDPVDIMRLRGEQKTIINGQGHWYLEADRAIRAAIVKAEEGGKTPTMEEYKRAIHDAYPFGQRRFYPYKAWLKARKVHLRALELKRVQEKIQL